MRKKIIHSRFLSIPAALGVAGVLLLAAWAHAEEEAPPAEAPEHGEANTDAPAKPTWHTGPPLNGKFDLTTLRSIERVSDYRFDLPVIETTFAGVAGSNTHIKLKITVEFGNESGMAELQPHVKPITSEFEALISRQDPRTLLTPAGKMDLKDALASILNQQLRTAVVRRIYFTDFTILRAG